MRRDTLFQRTPQLLFDLLPTPPKNATQYRFDSVAVKEPKFEIDGVFLPPTEPGIVYFCEVQFQKDDRLYERLFGEAFLYFYRNRDRFSDWRAVVLYPSRSLEQVQIEPYQPLLESDCVWRIYLNELGNIRELPANLAVMMLTVESPNRAIEEAKYLLQRTGAADTSAATNEREPTLETIVTILSYQFEQLSRQEIEAMLGITLQQTRLYQEARAEGRAEGRREEAASLLLRQLARRLGSPISAPTQQRLREMPLAKLEDLSEALLDFTSAEDLQTWLERSQPL